MKYSRFSDEEAFEKDFDVLWKFKIGRSPRYPASFFYKKKWLTAWKFFQSAWICLEHFGTCLEVLQNFSMQGP